MTNMWEGLGPDHTPTAPHDVAGAGRGAPWGGGPAGGGRRRRLWTAGLLIAAVAAGGGAFAVAEATGSPAASPTTPISLSASSATQDASTQAAALNAALSGHGGLARLRRLGGMYGQYTYGAKKGSRTLAFERGTISSVSDGNLVVRAQDGTTWAWDLTGTSVVRDDGKRTAQSALATGELVFAGGPVTGGARDARLIVIRTAASSKAASGTA
jgi:hypothetical protein